MLSSNSIYSLPSSSKVLVAALTIVSTLIFLIKLNHFRSTPEDQDTKFHDILVPYLQLIPRTTIFYPWVLLTAIFAEISVFSYITSFVILLQSTRYVEKFWGFNEVLKFVFVVGGVTNLWTVLVTITCNVLRGESAISMDIPLGGGISYYFGFLVVLKQLIPEHNVVLFQGVINFRVKHLPFIFLIVVLLVSVIITQSLYPFIPSIGSFVISYSYLRFYQTIITDPLLPITTANANAESSSSSGVSASGASLITGDASDAFRLVEFFPEISKPYLSPVFDMIYEIGCLLGVITPFNDDLIEQSNMRAAKRSEQASNASKSVANSVAERRRQVALQMIEERISKPDQS
ncbi:transmembrane protein 115 homolog [[Candida] railenensis]|uniref:Transmembrane protein 115 homolog n=1 Tax=[Candida] railenensis TaxID=45579 RepID=A0A9P0VW36_9ASCO|nr:transmembrane protein 115 homolog [[Candida] railenensis]